MTDIVDQLRKRDFILDQLSRYAGQKLVSGDHVKILCPFHSEKTPSGSIRTGNNNYVGYFRCFGCGAKSNWDDLAPRIGLQPFKRGKPKEETTVDLGMDRLMQAAFQQERYKERAYDFDRIPANRMWRGIPTNLLIEIGGEMCTYEGYDQYKNWVEGRFLYFPVTINNEKHGYFVARQKKQPPLPSYLLAASVNNSRWSSTHGLWPYGYALELMQKLKSRSLVIVEGQRDALRLINHGIPAMCIFGTQSWTPQKARLLELGGVRRPIVMMDGDPAGISATEKITPTLRELFDEVKVLKLWNVQHPSNPYVQVKHLSDPKAAANSLGLDFLDPGNAPVEILDKLKYKFF
jgi:5S rRNA maturation endonuclease (ribonuclease M5)